MPTALPVSPRSAATSPASSRSRWSAPPDARWDQANAHRPSWRGGRCGKTLALQARDRLAELVDLVGLAQDRKVAAHMRCRIAVAGREQDRQLRAHFAQAVGEGEAVHLAGHDNVGED